MRVPMLAALGLLILLVPQGAAQDEVEYELIVMSLDFSHDEMVFREQSVLHGDAAQDMRETIDADHGNDDGTVDLTEVAAFNRASEQTFTEDQPECFDDFDLATIDGLVPTRLSSVRTSVFDATGDVDSTMPIRETSSIAFLYPTNGSAPHNVVVEYDEMDSFGMAIGCYFSQWAEQYSDWEGDWEWEWADASYWNDPSSYGYDWDGMSPPSSGAWMDGETMDQPADQPDPGQAETGVRSILIQPVRGFRMDVESVQPREARDLWDGVGLRAQDPADQALLMESRVSFTLSAGNAASNDWGGTARDVGSYVGFATIGGGMVLGVFALATEFGRFHLWKLLFLIPGFSRLEKDEVLEHSKRDELYRFIKSNPGPSFSDLLRNLSLSNGTLVHHLRILEAQEYVKSVRDGFRTRFYVRGPKIVVESYLTRTQQQLVDMISGNPGLTQKELAQMLGLPRESVSYHTKQLAAKGRLSVKQEGKWRRYWLQTTPAPPAPSSPTPAARPV